MTVFNSWNEVWKEFGELPEAKYLITCKNKILNYVTGDVYPLNLNYADVQPLPIVYDLSLPMPMHCDEFLQRNLENQEQIDEILKHCAFLFCPYKPLDKNIDAFFVYQGKTGSGKSTWIKFIKHLLGNNNYIETSMRSLGDKFGLQNASDKLACILSDTDSRSTGREDLGNAVERTKKISCGEEIDIRMPGGKIYESVRLRMKLIFAGVELPKFSDSTAEMSRRAKVIVYKKQYSMNKIRYPDALDPEDGLDDKLKAERDSFFTHRVFNQGMKLLLRDGLKETDEGEELIDEAQAENDAHKEYWQTCTEKCDGQDISSDVFLNGFKTFCRCTHQEWELDRITFAKLTKRIRRDDDIKTETDRSSRITYVKNRKIGDRLGTLQNNYDIGGKM